MERIAFMIPVHPPKYHFVYAFLDKMIRYNCLPPMYLVFSNAADYASFERKEYITHIVLEDVAMNELYQVVSYKKYKGLAFLQNTEHEFIILCDSEIDIVPENFNSKNIYEKANAIFENKLVYAGNTSSNEFRAIFGASLNFFIDSNDNRIIAEKLENGNLYHWWSDLPVIKKDHLPDFFKCMGWTSEFPTYPRGAFSDPSYLYVNYLLVNHGFNVINTTPITRRAFSLEWLITGDTSILENLDLAKLGFGWVLHQLYNMNKKFFDAKKTFMLFHVDRHSN